MTSHVIANQKSNIILPTSSQNIFSMVFGVIILFAVGFMPMDVAHNAAHDTRHAMAFPCH